MRVAKVLAVLFLLLAGLVVGACNEKSPSEPGTEIRLAVRVVANGGEGLPDMVVGVQVPGDHVDGLKTDREGWTEIVTMRTRYREELDQAWVKVNASVSFQGFEGEVPLQELWNPREREFVRTAVVTLYM